MYYTSFARLYYNSFFYIKRCLNTYHLYTPFIVSIQVIDADTV